MKKRTVGAAIVFLAAMGLLILIAGIRWGGMALNSSAAAPDAALAIKPAAAVETIAYFCPTCGEVAQNAVVSCTEWAEQDEARVCVHGHLDRTDRRNERQVSASGQCEHCGALISDTYTQAQWKCNSTGFFYTVS